jgi:hypothetical protein
MHTQRGLLIYDDGTSTRGCNTEIWASFVKIRSRMIIVQLRRICCFIVTEFVEWNCCRVTKSTRTHVRHKERKYHIYIHQRALRENSTGIRN